LPARQAERGYVDLTRGAKHLKLLTVQGAMARSMASLPTAPHPPALRFLNFRDLICPFSVVLRIISAAKWGLPFLFKKVFTPI
jgi:hypothetical protein